MRLILASTSPRRRAILALLDLPFEVIAPEFDEQLSAHLSIEQEVLDFAVGKARSVAGKNPDSIVIGSDTLISLDGEKIGKPADQVDATRILRVLAGKTHKIYTSVAIIDGTGGPGLRLVEEVQIAMRDYTEGEIDRYVSFNESLDKAGAYSIQGEGHKLIDSVRGDYLAAVGMPLRPIADYLRSRGLSSGINLDRLAVENCLKFT